MIAPLARLRCLWWLPVSACIVLVALVLRPSPLGKPAGIGRIKGGPDLGQRLFGQQRCKCVEPEPGTVYAVPIGDAPIDGPDTALVTIVEGYEYGCPYCSKVEPTLERLREEYGRDLRIVKKQVVVHPQIATAASLAACAAHRQGKFAEMNQLLWDELFATRQFDAAHVEDLAKKAGLELSRYRRDVTKECPEQIDLERQQLQNVGMRATPTFFINGHHYSGAQPIESFRKVIDAELELARARVDHGTNPRDYYRMWVLESGYRAFSRRIGAPTR